MQNMSAILLATITVMVIVIAIALMWYNFMGWTTFTNKTGDSPSWAPPAGADISKLRFKNCVFSVSRADGVIKTQNVDAVLNGMAVAYRNGVNSPMALTLVRPLNAFSFVIPGFNDRATVSDPSGFPWCAAPPPACTADSDCPMVVDGACTNGSCFSCVGGATVSLTGSWRTV